MQQMRACKIARVRFQLLCCSLLDLHCFFCTPTTNISYRFPVLKLPPPPCAVLAGIGLKIYKYIVHQTNFSLEEVSYRTGWFAQIYSFKCFLKEPDGAGVICTRHSGVICARDSGVICTRDSGVICARDALSGVRLGKKSVGFASHKPSLRL